MWWCTYYFFLGGGAFFTQIWEQTTVAERYFWLFNNNVAIMNYKTESIMSSKTRFSMLSAAAPVETSYSLNRLTTKVSLQLKTKKKHEAGGTEWYACKKNKPKLDFLLASQRIDWPFWIDCWRTIELTYFCLQKTDPTGLTGQGPLRYLPHAGDAGAGEASSVNHLTSPLYFLTGTLN